MSGLTLYNPALAHAVHLLHGVPDGVSAEDRKSASQPAHIEFRNWKP